MIQNKRNNGWILCPSKTFPGKFYYFNVVNGEAAWSLTEVENKIQKKDGFLHRVADKSHTFPEPSSPPTDESPNIPSNNYFNNTHFGSMPQRIVHNTQTPMFGQVSFQKYVEPYMPNIVWTPIQLPPPMYVGNPTEMRNASHIMQSAEPERRLLVQTCNVSLTERFSNYSRQPKPFRMGNRQIFNNFYDTSTPLKNIGNETLESKDLNNSFENLNIQKPKLIKEPVFKRNRTQSESDNKETKKVTERANSLESLLNFNDAVIEKSTLMSFNKVNSAESNKAPVESVKVLKDGQLGNLDKNDLRYLLVAKRKSVDSGDPPENCEVSGKKIKIAETESQKTKKRVTFDLGLEDISNESLPVADDSTIPQDCDMPTIEEVDADSLVFVVVDFTTLLDDFQAIEDYVQADDKRRLMIPPRLRSEIDAACLGDCCGRQRVMLARQISRKMLAPPEHYDDKRRLMIPPRLRSDIDAACLGDCCGRQRVMLARQISRKMLAPPEHYVLLPDSEESPGAEVENYTLDCCMDVMNSGHAAVLITNDDDLYKDAKNLNIKCYKIQEIKDGDCFAKPEVSFDLKKVKISINKDQNMKVTTKKSSNLFLQPVSEIESQKLPVNVHKKRLLESIGEKATNSSNKQLKDANTSPINCDKLIDLTRKKHIKQNVDNNNFKDANTSPINTETPKIITINNNKLIDSNEKSSNLNKINIENQNAPQTRLTMQQLFIQENQKYLNKEKSPVKLDMPNVESEIKDFGKAFDRVKPIELTAKQRSELEILRNSFNSAKVETYSLNERLRAYSLKYKDIEGNLKVRMEELMCVFTQIMENALVDVLMRDSSMTDKLSPPWVLYEATKRIQNLYESHTELKLVAEKFRELLMTHSKIAKQNCTLQPYDFMKMLGCGIILIETLETILPNYEELLEAESSLQNLLQNLTKPMDDELPVFRTPVLRRCEDTLTDERHNFVKKPSDIIAYLKAHFEEWKNVDVQSNHYDVKKNEPKVLRTLGRDLNLLEIDNNKDISIKKPAEKSHCEGIEKIKLTAENSPKETQENTPKTNLNTILSSYKKAQPIIFRKFSNSFTIPKLSKTCNISKYESKANELQIDAKDINTVNQKNESTTLKVVRTLDGRFKSNSTSMPLNVNWNEPKNANTKTEETDNSFKNNNLLTSNIKEPNKSNNETGPKIIRTLNNTTKDIATPMALDMEDLVPKHGNTFNQEYDTFGPKVTRNVQPIEAFEEKIKTNANIFDLNALDYSEIDENDNTPSPKKTDTNDDTVSEVTTDRTVSFVYQIKSLSRNNNAGSNKIIQHNDNAIDSYQNDKMNCQIFNDESFLYNENALHNDNDSVLNNCSSALVNETSDKAIINNDSTDDSGFENESLHAYSLVKIFLSEISESFKAVYRFIDRSVNEFRHDEMEGDRVQMLRHKANSTHLLISGIIDKLKGIIQRESNEGTTLQAMLLKAGLHASTDKRITRYRQVVTKCLEQAQILESALKTMLALTDHDFETLSTATANSDIRYFNIFE